ncbi:MAG: hypothetical protein V4550_14975 [Gemmatimonadota bacterium]
MRRRCIAGLAPVHVRRELAHLLRATYDTSIPIKSLGSAPRASAAARSPEDGTQRRHQVVGMVRHAPPPESSARRGDRGGGRAGAPIRVLRACNLTFVAAAKAADHVSATTARVGRFAAELWRYGTLRYSTGESIRDVPSARADRQKGANQQLE